MLKDCQSRDIEIILTKSISRFGRDTVEILDALNQLRILGVRVIFEQEVLDTADTDNDLMISIIESIAQAENESRSDNIKWGIKQHAAQGTSKLYNRKCYGYYNDEDGNLAIDEKEAKKEMTHLPYFHINLSRFRYINMNVNIFTRQSWRILTIFDMNTSLIYTCLLYMDKTRCYIKQRLY